MKTRIAFMAQMRFASVNRASEEAIDVHLRLARADDFDRELLAWLRASYEEYGTRQWLER